SCLRSRETCARSAGSRKFFIWGVARAAASVGTRGASSCGASRLGRPVNTLVGAFLGCSIFVRIGARFAGLWWHALLTETNDTVLRKYFAFNLGHHVRMLLQVCSRIVTSLPNAFAAYGEPRTALLHDTCVHTQID